MQGGQWGQIPLLFHFTSYIFIGFFCFVLILKCGGFHILVLVGRTVKVHCAILYLMNPLLLHLVWYKYYFSQCCSVSPGGLHLGHGLPLWWRGLHWYRLFCYAAGFILYIRPWRQVLGGWFQRVFLPCLPEWGNSWGFVKMPLFCKEWIFPE